MAGSNTGKECSLLERIQVSRQAIPIVERVTASISKSECKRLARIAERLSSDEPALSSANFPGTQVEAGLFDGPAVLIGDNREIALASERDAKLFEYRISHLAANEDILLLGGDRNAAFERYRQIFLGLGTIDSIVLPTDRFADLTPLATRCLSDTTTFNKILARTREAGKLTIVPHIGTESAWMLAAAVAEHSRKPVRVAAPPPRLTRRVNDKVWFSHRVDEVLGPRAKPPFHAVFGPTALAATVHHLALRSERVVIKVPDSSGSAGNLSLSCSTIKSLSTELLGTRLVQMLNEMGWKDVYPLLVEIWDTHVLANPSVQVWIPDRRDGPPIVEGIFEQRVAGPNGEFIGSVPATIADRWVTPIGSETLKLATLFQHLGYFGRCSFDAVIAGSHNSSAALHWLECNGRWGGVSVPMTLANRLTTGQCRDNFVVVQRDHMNFQPRQFLTALRILEPMLYRVTKRSEGVVLLSPFGIERGTAIHLLALAENTDRAKHFAECATQVLTRKLNDSFDLSAELSVGDVEKPAEMSFVH